MTASKAASKTRRLIPLATLTSVVLLAAAAVFILRAATDLASAVSSYRPTYEVLGRLARLRSLAARASRPAPSPPPPWEGSLYSRRGEPEKPAEEPDHLGPELDRLAASLAAEPEQVGRLDHLKQLLSGAGAGGGASRVDGQDPEIERLIAELEQEELALLRRADVAVQAATSRLLLFGAVGGTGAVGSTLIALTVAKWALVRRRRTAKRVTQLLARQQELSDKFEYLERYDPLTRLPNRRYLAELLDLAIAWAKEEAGRVLSVLITDVNRLKHINVMFGLDAGDQVMKTLAQRLEGAVGAQDIVARTTGGEFVVVFRDESRPIDTLARAELIQKLVSKSVSVADEDVVVTSSAGIAIYPDHGRDAQALLRNADLALARARSQGRNTIQVFDEGLSKVVSDLFTLERRLSAALKNREYIVHYQPYCNLASSQVEGAEALIKWKGASSGLVPASRFIPVLEETGMIVDVGRWVLQTACGQVKEWQQREWHLPVAVNLSLIQFRDKYLVEMVADVISAHHLDPTHLTLEITEGICLQDVEFAIRTLKRLKDMGVTISIDDFGTGYSSLSYLKKLPVDTIKIDISFVRDVTDDPDTVSIVTAITALARSLRIRTIAEGVETDEQRRILQLLRCDLGQGFLFSPALPSADLEAFAAQARATSPRPSHPS